MIDSSEAQWVADAIGGDSDAFGRLVRTHSSAVCAITLAITRDPTRSEEVAQDVFLLAWTRLPQLKNPDSFGPWLRQLSRNRSREFLRAARRRSRRTHLDNAAVERAVTPTTPADHVLDAEERQVVAEALEALPDETREVLILYYREGRSVRQVATLLGLSEAAVRKRLSRARVRLREEVDDRFEGVLVRTMPGSALVVGVLGRLPSRGGAGLVRPSLGTGAAFGVGLAMLVGAGALLWYARTGEELGNAGPERAQRPSPEAWGPRSLATGISESSETEAEEEGVGSAAESGPASGVSFEGEGDAWNPVFSPDGRHLAFEVHRPAGAVDLFVSEVQVEVASHGRRLALPGGTAFGGNDRVAANPTWHPQGILVFEASNQTGQHRLYYHQPSGRQSAEMIGRSELAGHLTFPTLSGDGQLLALVLGDDGSADLAVRHASTGQIERLTTTPEAESFPTFSGDGRELLFTRQSGADYDVFALELAGRTERRVVGGPGIQVRPSVALDGQRVVFFQQDEAQRWGLRSVDRSGDVKVLADDIRLPKRARPAISPDGEWVAWASSTRDKGGLGILSRVDGSETVELPTRHVAVGEPALGLVGGRVMLAYTALEAAGADARGVYLVDITERMR